MVRVPTQHISGLNIQLRKNFNMQEFFKPKLTGGGGHGMEFDIPEVLLDGMQFISDTWMPEGGICITSVYRPNDKFGYHRFGKAGDFVTYKDPMKWIDKWKEECLNHRDSYLIRGLRQIGITGFGVEKNCSHIDAGGRNSSTLYPVDEFGQYCVFTWCPARTEEEKEKFPNGLSKLIN